MTIERIAVIGLGEVGSILVEDLLKNTRAAVRAWDIQFSNPESAPARNLERFAANPRFAVASGASEAAMDCQLVLSAVTADQALNAAQSTQSGLTQNAFFVDLNSVSPGTKRGISSIVSAAGGRFVEASVMSPIMPLRSSSPILLGGPHARDLHALGADIGFSDLLVVSEEVGVASATKMCRSVIVKGIEALVTESLLTARFYGVEASVLASLDNLFPGPDWPGQARYLISRTLQHGTRRAAEMREAAKTVEEAGYQPWMSDGCVERQAWAPQFSSALAEESLGGLLDVIRHQHTHHAD